MEEFEEFEREDYDAELLNRGDYDAVLQLRKNQLESHPKDYWTRYKWADILQLTKKYKEALDVLEALHQEKSEDIDVIDLILKCLRKTNQSPNVFKWKIEPKISFLNEDLIDTISKYLKGKRKHNRTVQSVYLHFLMSEYRPFYDESELYSYLKQSNEVHLIGEEWYEAWIKKID